MRRIIFPTIILFVLISVPMVVSKPELGIQGVNSTETSINVEIQDAFYDDLDRDGYFDDVYGLIYVSYSAQSALSFDYYIELILPSGLSFSYLFVISTNYPEIYLHNYFWDHAIESGDYVINVKVVLHNGGQVTSETSLVFDPPGGSCCTDPTFSLESS